MPKAQLFVKLFRRRLRFRQVRRLRAAPHQLAFRAQPQPTLPNAVPVVSSLSNFHSQPTFLLSVLRVHLMILILG